ncbi:ADP-ribose glycohydrolase MACROD2 isoform X2 [Mixophyes fleayi]|uniref:ADP-ribose glycohydrolase MACROD2 isoform X2 n=1 Tax=Mixophyes fleayi TaxID=3061075 RepID=UPI003F4D8AF6
MYPNSNKKKKIWNEEKERLLNMSQAERRKELDKNYIPLDSIPTLMDEMRKASNDDENQEINSLCDKVSLYKGDITQLEVDVIVNAANASLLGGGGVDGCIHRASGTYLFDECRMLGGCSTGQAKITCGYRLPARYVIHTVGPIARGQLNERHREDLASCYKSSLALAKENKIKSIAFPCISTGIYGFPNEPAANIALKTAKEWLKVNREIDRIIFCVFLEVDYKIYKKKLEEFFPKDGSDDEKDDKNDDNKEISEETILTAAVEDINEPVQDPEDTEDIKELSSECTQEMKDPDSDSEPSETSNVLPTVPDADMMESSQAVTEAEVENPPEMGIKTEDERSTEFQEPDQEDVSKTEDPLCNPPEDEPNEPLQPSQETNQISDTFKQLESEGSDDVHMLSQNIDSSNDEHGDNIATAEAEK